MQISHIEINSFPDVTGVILAGGRSSRMGRDKAHLKIGGESLFERSLHLLQGLFNEVIIAGNRPDLARAAVPCHPDIYPGSALGGLYTGLLGAPTDWIFAVPCDMPHPDPKLARALLARRSGEHQAVIPRTRRGLEPLFALYHKGCLPAMKAMLETGRYSILDLYPDIHFICLEESDIPTDWEKALLNLNTVEDLKKVREEGA